MSSVQVSPVAPSHRSTEVRSISRARASRTYLLEHHRYKRHVSRAYKMLHDINLPVSRRLIKVLAQEPFPITVTNIFIKLRQEQCVVSRHLSKLLKHGMVSYVKKGKLHYYSLNADRVTEINSIIHRFVHEGI